MDNRTNHCYKCEFFHRYFIKKDTDFQKSDFGYCYKNKTVVNIRGNCEYYSLCRKQKKYEPLIKIRLEALLTEISVLRNLIEEESRDDKKKDL